MMEIENKKISKDDFMGLRQEVLSGWSTGRDVKLEEAFVFHKSLPENKIFSKKLIKAKEEKITLIQPRAGVALVDEQIKLLLYLQNIVHSWNFGTLGLLVLFCKTNGFKRMDSLLQYVHRR